MAQWWDEWQLRILVLASLCAQYLLVLFAAVRKYHLPPWLTATFRPAHIGSDALAIFALATLFNRQKGGPRCSYAGGSRDLELLWAPILVMHLGGQVAITSYKIEDNEQWSRHILTSLSKVAAALYVFYKSWSSDNKRLLAATVLLFILVTVRCFQKALDLKSSSFNALRKASSSEVSVVQHTNDITEDSQLDNFIQAARDRVENGAQVRFIEKVKSFFGLEKLPALTYQLFLDFPCPYDDRLKILERFWSLKPRRAYEVVEGALSHMTSFLYTKDDNTRYLRFKNEPAPLSIFRRCTHFLVHATLITAICLVHTCGRRGAYSGEDPRVTLVMLYGTLLLELVYFYVQNFFPDRFSGRILRYSLFGLLAYNRRPSRLRSIVGWWLYCKDLADEYFWPVEPDDSCQEITELVRQHVKSGWRGYIRDNVTYKRFNDSRGELTLTSKRCLRQLGWSLKRPFDETIMLWHLATGLCFYHKEITRNHPQWINDRQFEDHCRQLDRQCAHQCKEISNYMMHLLFHNPEMLMPGSRKGLFAKAYDELKNMLKSEKSTLDGRDLTRLVIRKCKAGSTHDSLIRDAWVLAERLLRDELDDYGEVTSKWEVIRGVWVEMLCFSAGCSRGYLHAQALGTGVEYLSYVWVLWAYAGMETFSEKLQKREGQSVNTDESYGLQRTDTFPDKLQRRECQSADNDESASSARKIRRTRSI